MKVLLTGVCGFVGAHVAKGLAEQDSGLCLYGIDNLSRSGSWTNWEPLRRLGVQLFHGDVRCQSDFDALPAVDWVIDGAANPTVLAGLSGAGSSRQLIEHNLLGTLNVLEYCRRHRAGLILLSSSRVYSIEAISRLPLRSNSTRYEFVGDAAGHASSRGVDETFPTTPPVSLYGSTKLASENLSVEYSAAFDFPVRINRCGVMAGAGQFGKADQGIFSYWLHSWRERKSLRYIGYGGRGLQVRDCLHPLDLADLIRKQMAAGDAQTLVTGNVSGGAESARSLAELSIWCAERWGTHQVGLDPEVRPYDVPWLVLDNELVSRTWNWTPRVATGEILAEIADFADSNPNWRDLVG